MTIYDLTTLRGLAEFRLPDNNSEQISPEDVRQTFLDAIDSLEASPGPTFLPNLTTGVDVLVSPRQWMLAAEGLILPDTSTVPAGSEILVTWFEQATGPIITLESLADWIRGGSTGVLGVPSLQLTDLGASAHLISDPVSNTWWLIVATGDGTVPQFVRSIPLEIVVPEVVAMTNIGHSSAIELEIVVPTVTPLTNADLVEPIELELVVPEVAPIVTVKPNVEAIELEIVVPGVNFAGLGPEILKNGSFGGGEYLTTSWWEVINFNWVDDGGGDGHIEKDTFGVPAYARPHVAEPPWNPTFSSALKYRVEFDVLVYNGTDNWITFGGVETAEITAAGPFSEDVFPAADGEFQIEIGNGAGFAIDNVSIRQVYS